MSGANEANSKPKGEASNTVEVLPVSRGGSRFAKCEIVRKDMFLRITNYPTMPYIK